MIEPIGRTRKWRAWPLSISASIIVLAVSMSLRAMAAEAADHWKDYDASRCKRDTHGNIYFGLGRNVFGVPHATVPYLGEIYTDHWANRIVPPDPKEPIGCPDNPYQLESYGFGYAHLSTDDSAPGRIADVHPGKLLVELIRTLPGDAVPSLSDKTWMGEEVQAGISDDVCATATVREQISGGITVCRRKQSEREVRVEDWRTAYVSSPEHYGTPLGKTFVVNCSDLSFSLGGQCNVAYTLLPGLGVTYRFAVRKGDVLQIEPIVDFDRGMRAFVNEMLVKDYPWPSIDSNIPNSVGKRMK
jgi:hypothetical protein